MIAIRNCPKCGYENAANAKICERCQASLVITCPRCGEERPWYVPRCSCADAMQPPDASAFDDLFRGGPGRTVARKYALGSRLAAGRVSAVYAARDTETGRCLYAIKELSPIALFRPKERRQLARKIETTIERWNDVSHPAIPPILDLFVEEDKYYVVMPYVPGVTVREMIEGYQVSFSPQVAAAVGAQVCDLLALLHRQDRPQFVPFLAPAHLIMSTTGQVAMVDLGLSSLFLPKEYGPYGSLVGYGAPELKTGVPSVQSDLFALGRVLYAGLTGRLLDKRGRSRPLPLQQAVPGISPHLVKAVARAAHRDPDRRFESAMALRGRLWPNGGDERATVREWVSSLPSRRPSETLSSAAAAQTAPQGDARPARRLQDRRRSRSVQSRGPSMSEFGFEADNRFGQRSATDTRRPTAPTPPPSIPEREQPAARLSVQPRHMVISDLGSREKRRVVLRLHNPGETPVEGRIVSHVGWLSAPSRTFTLPAGKQARAVLTVDGTLLAPGQTGDPQALAVHVGTRRQWIAVTAEIPVGPALAVEPRIIDFGTLESDRQQQARLRLVNRGSESVSGSIRVRAPWLRVAADTFACGSGRSRDVQVTLLTEHLPSGIHALPEAIVVDSDAGQERVEVRATVRRPVLQVSAGAIDLGDVREGALVEQRVVVTNEGESELVGNARALVPWLEVYPDVVCCAPGESTEITVRAQASGLSAGTIAVAEAVRLGTNGGTRVISVRMSVLAPLMQISTSHLAFGTITDEAPSDYGLMIQNSGTAPLRAEISALLPWISCDEQVVEVVPGGEQAIRIRLDVTGFEHGTEAQQVPALRIVAGSDVRVVTASVVVLRPLLSIEPDSLDFGYADPSQPETRVLRVTNDGTGTLGWSIAMDAPWVELAPESGRCGPGESIDVTLTAYGLALEQGVQSAKGVLVINSDGGRAKVPLTLSVASPRLATDAPFLDLGESVNYGDVSAPLRVFNYGLGLLSGTIRCDETWIALDRVSFECETGRSVEIRVSTDLADADLQEQYITAHLIVETNGGDAEITAGLTIVYEPHVEVRQQQILLKSSGRDGDLRGRLTLRNTGLAGAHIELVSTHPDLSLSRTFCDIKPGKSVRITLTWTGPAPEDAPEMAVQIRSDDKPLADIAVHFAN